MNKVLIQILELNLNDITPIVSFILVKNIKIILEKIKKDTNFKVKKSLIIK